MAHEPLTYHRAAAMLDELAEALADGRPRRHRRHLGRSRPRHDHHQRRPSWPRPVAALSGRPVAAPGSPEATADYLADRVQPGDIVLAMGGGRSYVIAERLVALLETASAE